MALFVKLETTWADHPKIIAAGLDGRGLHATALCISKRLETDGWIDRALLHREGATDDLIDRLVELHLFDAEGTRVRPHNWHDRNPSQGAIDATRSAKAEAARAGNHKRWKHPKPIAQCEICTPNPQVDRISDRSGSHAVAEPSPDTDTETETEQLPLIKSQDYTGTERAEPSHDDEPAAAPPDATPAPPVDLEQTIRRTAALVGRAIATNRPGIDNPTGYAQGATRQILDPTGDGIDRERITRQLQAGQTPEAIAAAWTQPQADPLTGLYPTTDTPAAPRPTLKPFDRDAHEAEAETQRLALEALEAERPPETPGTPSGTEGPKTPGKAADGKTGGNRGPLRAVRKTA